MGEDARHDENRGEEIQMRQAVIDIGSNSVRLMLMRDKRVSKQIITTRLAEGAGGAHILQESQIYKTVKAVEEFIDIARKANVEQLYVYATEALRSATNKEEFLERIRPFGVEVDILTGEQEAKLGYIGAGAKGKTLVDVGGASTEMCDGKKSLSFPIGAVKIYERCGYDINAILSYIAEVFDPIELKADKLVGIGGTATTIACMEKGLTIYDTKEVQGTVLTRKCVTNWAKRILAMPLEDRYKLIGLDRMRAKIIGGGALLLSRIMKRCDIDVIEISDKDNLEGYLMWKNGEVQI